MPIQVTCPSCLKRFSVSDKFAGKTGPCPSCKKPLRVPDKSEEVVIHAPVDLSPKDSQGRSVLTPILREERPISKQTIGLTLTAIIAIFAAAVGLRVTGGEDVPLLAQVFGIIALAPPLVSLGYTFFQDSELAPYVGAERRNRVLICAAIFAALWILYAFVPSYVLDLQRAAEMPWMVAGIMFSVMLVLGAFASVATFEVEFPTGLAHAGLYVVSVIVLAVIAGVPLAGLPT